MKVAEDESYNALIIDMPGAQVNEAEIVLEAVDKGEENSDDELDRVEIAMTQYIDSTAEKHGLSTVPDDEDKDKWLLLGDDTHDFGWDATNLPPGVHRAAPEGQSIIIAEGDLFDQETVVSLELVSEADDSEAAGMSSMITAESVAFESVTEGTSTSKQPPTPPPSRRGAAANCGGTPVDWFHRDWRRVGPHGCRLDRQAPGEGDAEDCEGQGAAGPRRGGTPVEKAERP